MGGGEEVGREMGAERALGDLGEGGRGAECLGV